MTTDNGTDDYDNDDDHDHDHGDDGHDDGGDGMTMVHGLTRPNTRRRWHPA